MHVLSESHGKLQQANYLFTLPFTGHEKETDVYKDLLWALLSSLLILHNEYACKNCCTTTYNVKNWFNYQVSHPKQI